jgi:hypothetical protein
MTENLFPEELETEELEFSEFQEDIQDDFVGYKKGPCFDENLGDFKRDGTKKLVACSGVETWKQWCIKVLQTKRYACRAYGDTIGIDTELVFQGETKNQIEDLLEREIVNTLEADPYERTEHVESVEFQWSGDESVEVKCKIIGVDSNEIDITAKINQ